ncbi:MAG: hypothetical protein ABR566_02505 [Pyrinomonadaceae bacterium]
MPKKPKEKTEKEKEATKPSEENRKETWEEDQREKSYYYDDAHGYEIYNPDEDDEEDE